jgi:hypothetical protein
MEVGAVKVPSIRRRIAVAEALMPCTAEYRMIGDIVLNAELAKPPIGQIHLNLGANLSL